MRGTNIPDPDCVRCGTVSEKPAMERSKEGKQWLCPACAKTKESDSRVSFVYESVNDTNGVHTVAPERHTTIRHNVF